MLLGQRSNRNGCGVTEWRVQEVWKADLREKREALTFLLVLVAGSAVTIGTGGAFFWWLSLALPFSHKGFFVSLQLRQSNLLLK
jgi:hypothetical protein